MVFKVNLVPAMIVASQIEVLQNPHDGVRSIRLSGIDICWTGTTHLHVEGSITLQVCDIADGVYSRTSLDEDNEPWRELVTCPPISCTTAGFYKHWSDFATRLEEALGGL